MVRRIYFFYGILILSFLLLLGRLFELQVIFGEKHLEMAEGNRIRKVINPAPRGIIFDRQKKELVRNVPLYRICQAVTGSQSDCQPVTREEALKIEVRGGKEAENLRVDVGRSYVYGRALAHILGYLGELNEEEVKRGKGNSGDLTGRTGVEEKFNSLLKGIDGGEVFEVNAFGEKIREIGKTPSIPGKNLYLSLDAELSKVAFAALEEKPGAVVVSEAKTGQILVLVSSPSFNPEKITPEILSDNAQPMFNRAITGLYPPGSTFKIVTATSGLEEGKIDENTLYKDKGIVRVGEFVYKNWYFNQYGKTEGSIGVVRAIKRSTDTFFYKVGEWVGPEKLAQWATKFGLGKKTEIEIPGEVDGLVPSPQWKEKFRGERWYLGNTYHFAIGQADLLTTPLQINMMTSVIANEGKLCQPNVARLSDSKMPMSNCQDLNLKKETLRLVKEGMKEACSSGGTAFPFFNFQPAGLPADWRVGCKTGTAEFGNPQNLTHAWLTAFAPVDDPKIVVTVLMEAGGEGSYVAAPVAKKVIEAWFNK